MSETRFDLVILSHTSHQSTENLVQDLLLMLDKAGDPYLEYKLSEALLFEQSSSAILSQITAEEGAEFQSKFQQFKVETELRPTLQLVAKEPSASAGSGEQYTCPACQHTQPKQSAAGTMNTCNRCGVIGEKLEKSQRKEEIYQIEKRKLRQAQKQQFEEATELAQHNEAENLRQEARQRLGVKKKKSPASVMVGIAVIGLVGVGSYFIVDTLRNSAEIEAADTVTSADAGSAVKKNTAKTGVNTTANKAADGEQKPLVTIQGGSGSIVVNNNAQPGADSTGKGGSKGTTGTAIQTTSNGNTENKPTNNSASTTLNADNSGGSNAMTEAAIAPPNSQSVAGTVAQISHVRAANTNQLTPSSANTGINNTQPLTASASTSASASASASASVNPTQNTTRQRQHTMQLAALTPTKKTGTVGLQHAVTTATITKPAELNVLKAILYAEHDHSEDLFSNITQDQLSAQQKRLKRLLDLGKPDLALVFAEGIDDPYAASLMVLEVAKYEAKNNSSAMHDDLLLSMKALVTKGDSVANQAMLNAGLSQIYNFTGDKASAQTILENSMQSLHTASTGQHQCHLLAQMAQNHRDFGAQTGEDFYASTLISFVSGLPKTDRVQAIRIYTHLAAAALAENNQEDAEEWLKHIPAKDVQQYLLIQLRTLAAKAKRQQASN